VTQFFNFFPCERLSYHIISVIQQDIHVPPDTSATVLPCRHLLMIIPVLLSPTHSSKWDHQNGVKASLSRFLKGSFGNQKYALLYTGRIYTGRDSFYGLSTGYDPHRAGESGMQKGEHRKKSGPEKYPACHHRPGR